MRPRLLPRALAAACPLALAACSAFEDAAPPRFAPAAYANADTAAFVGEWTWIGRVVATGERLLPFDPTPTPGTTTGLRVLNGRVLQRQVDGAWQAPQPYRFVAAEPTTPGELRRVRFASDGLDPCGGMFALDTRHFATLGVPCDGGNDYYRRR